MNKYVIQDLIGKGSYGSVYKVLNKQTNLINACKILPKIRIYSKEKQINAIHKINREIDIWQQLNDYKYVCKLYDTIEDDLYVYLIQEYCEYNLLDYTSVYPLNIKNYIYALLLFLDYCHSKNIVYADLKPHNLLLNKNFELRVIDFGCSRIINPNKMNIGFMGTPIYCSPELWNQEYNNQIDSWSLGILLYHMYTGKFPFWKEPLNVIIKDKSNSLKNDIKYIDVINHPKISEKAMDLIKKLLDKNYATRLTCKEALDHAWFKEPEPEAFWAI